MLRHEGSDLTIAAITKQPSFFNGIRLNLFCRISFVIPLAVEWKITSEPFPAMFGGKMFPALDRCNNVCFRRPTLLQSILSMWMQSDFHNKSTLTSGIGTTNLPSHNYSDWCITTVIGAPEGIPQGDTGLRP